MLKMLEKRVSHSKMEMLFRANMVAKKVEKGTSEK